MTLTAVLVVAAVVVVLAVVGALVVVRTARRRYAAANEVVPGVATRAPAAWAGAHSVEARLHRRLRDAVAAVQAAGHDDFTVVEARAALEQQALHIDDRLVAVAALPERVRGEPLARVSAAVDAVEEAAAAIAGATPALDGRSSLDEAVAQVAERVALLAEARAELEDGATPSPGLSAAPAPSPAAVEPRPREEPTT